MKYTLVLRIRVTLEWTESITTLATQCAVSAFDPSEIVLVHKACGVSPFLFFARCADTLASPTAAAAVVAHLCNDTAALALALV